MAMMFYAQVMFLGVMVMPVLQPFVLLSLNAFVVRSVLFEGKARTGCKCQKDQ
jgi:hypothetical protein